MKIGIISDIHSNIYGLKAVLSELSAADKIVCAGDITGYYTFPNEVIELLIEKKIAFIKGNFDDFIIQGSAGNPLIKESVNFTRSVIKPENLKILENAPTNLDLTIDGKKIKVYHGSPWQANEYINPDIDSLDRFKTIEADVIILGHTHKPMILHDGPKLIINPGSCGQPRDYDDRASFAIYDTETGKGELKRVKYDYSEVIAAIKKQNLSQDLIEILQRTK